MEKAKIKRIQRRIISIIGGSAEVFIGTGLSAFSPIIGIPIFADGVIRTANNIKSQNNNSMMSVEKNTISSNFSKKQKNTIVQNPPTLTQLINLAAVKDKKTLLVMQELNFLLNADKFDNKGNKIEYFAHSQSLTKLLLRKAEKAGFIENFNSVESKKTQTLFLEKVALGNLKGLSKKEKMHEMTFNISDKEITDDTISKFLGVKQLDENKFRIKRDKKGNISSINFKTIPAIAQRISNVKQKMLPEKANILSLPENENNDKSDILSNDELSRMESLKVMTYPKDKILEEDYKNDQIDQSIKNKDTEYIKE